MQILHWLTTLYSLKLIKQINLLRKKNIWYGPEQETSNAFSADPEMYIIGLYGMIITVPSASEIIIRLLSPSCKPQSTQKGLNTYLQTFTAISS